MKGQKTPPESSSLSRGIEGSDITPKLLSDLRDGDYDAFDLVFVRFYSPIKSFLSKLTRSKSVGEDLTQDVFVSLWNNREKINPEGNFKSYLYTISRNMAMNHFRSRKVRDNFRMQIDPEDGQSERGDELVEAKELQLLIDMVVENMPRQRKKIYRLSRVDGISNDQISKQLKISKNAVERHLTFALKDIKDVLMAVVMLMSL